jgi:hypothetical protein
MHTRHFTLPVLAALVLTLVGCPTSTVQPAIDGGAADGAAPPGVDLPPPYDSSFDPSASFGSLSEADRLAFCRGWTGYTLDLIGQDRWNTLSEERQAVNATTTPEECRALLPRYEEFRPYPLLSGTCEAIARGTAGCTQTVDQLERGAAYLAANQIELEAHLSCDLAAETDPSGPIDARWRAIVPAEVNEALTCFLTASTTP